MYSKTILKKTSRKKLYKIIWELKIELGKKALELSVEEYINSINKKSLEYAESDLVYKEKEIAHKDRLLSALTKS